MQFLKPSLNVLKQFYGERDLNLKLLLSSQLQERDCLQLEPSERHAVTRTVYGVVRWRLLLHYFIQEVSDRKLNKIQARVLLLLEIGTYLLLFSTSYPDYAVVNEVVACAGGKTKSFVNALLRNILRRKTALLTTLPTLQNLEIKYAMPRLVVDRLQEISTNLEADLHYLNQEPQFHLRVNTRDMSMEQARILLLEKGIPFKELAHFQSFEIKEASTVIHQLIQSGPFYFQNTASQTISMLASRLAQRAVLDCCAAPGTKSVTLSLLNPQLTIYANDIHRGRAKLINEFSHRFALDNIHTIVSDILHPPLSHQLDHLDFILVDAPCTSMGTLRKNPDLKQNITPERIRINAQTQFQMMHALLPTITQAGTYILYSVCSFSHEETEGVMQRIFRELPGATRYETIDLTPFLTELGFSYKKETYGTYLLPSESLNNDLFYLSLLKL